MNTLMGEEPANHATTNPNMSAEVRSMVAKVLDPDQPDWTIETGGRLVALAHRFKEGMDVICTSESAWLTTAEQILVRNTINKVLRDKQLKTLGYLLTGEKPSD